jgi:hypothetical protein
MKRDAYGQLEHNSYPLLRRVGPVEPTTPWAMRLTDSDGLFRFLCFDFDGKDKTGTSPELVEQAVDDCDQLSRILEDHGVPHVVCQSSSSGGRHLWVGIRGGAAASVVAALGRVAHQVLPPTAVPPPQRVAIGSSPGIASGPYRAADDR